MNNNTTHAILDRAIEAYVQNQRAIDVNDQERQVTSYNIFLTNVDHFASKTGLTRNEAIDFVIDESRRVN